MMWYEEISEGAHVGTTTHQGVPGGPGAPRWVGLCPPGAPPFGIVCTKNSEIFRKNHVNFLEHSENFYFGSFFNAREIQKTDKTWHFILFN